jgi:hypothetical protein
MCFVKVEQAGEIIWDLVQNIDSRTARGARGKQECIFIFLLTVLEFFVLVTLLFVVSVPIVHTLWGLFDIPPFY